MTTDSADAVGSDTTSSRIEAEREEDQRVDAKALLVIFTALVLGVVFYISGWTFDI